MIQKNKNKFIYTKDDVRLINSLKKFHYTDAWSHTKKHSKLTKIKLEKFKRRIKDFLLEKENYECSYCRKNLHGETYMVIDIEHILPKSIFKEFMFDVNNNLSISCRRCNAGIKKTDISFLKKINLKKISLNYKNRNFYKFIHPNLDDYYKHIDYYVSIKNKKKVIHYSKKTKKGYFTYKYFLLEDLELSHNSNIQNVKYQSKLSTSLSNKYEDRVNTLMRRAKNSRVRTKS
ncbi:HNH endonuclease [Arcobacter roscoffensis]|uniref:HNH nuclease domain-containing protein n=1 Tax=Arcobacter roscoffensis TaxID=2961520 RepID=A0ABY5E6G1_9BACT|nr:HNH endonuclease domain-containing protein [Arcobacter roscoffensis]UTJ06718.1 hypothetical protein NJU99_01085 [Arcobacter roscoffensis]